MKARTMAWTAACFAAAFGITVAGAQTPAAPAFAASNLTDKGVSSMAAGCAACHGTAGRAARDSTLGSLAGRSRDDLARTMGQFKSGQRPASVMHQIAKGYSEAEIAALAEYFSKQSR